MDRAHAEAQHAYIKGYLDSADLVKKINEMVLDIPYFTDCGQVAEIQQVYKLLQDAAAILEVNNKR